jgi:hypothetical protein
MRPRNHEPFNKSQLYLPTWIFKQIQEIRDPVSPCKHFF